MEYITKFDRYLFGQGTHYNIYDKLGAHPIIDENGNSGVHFAVWAPHAAAVSVVGDFNGWDPCANPMRKIVDEGGESGQGIYETFIEGLAVGNLYKYCITSHKGKQVLKADPYGFACQKRPETASIVANPDEFSWGDSAFLEKRKSFDAAKSPVLIYEVHPGSWMKHPATQEDEDGFYNYRELARRLCDYVKDMGYTHVELMGIAEHPFDGSWGYQVSGYYAPTSRYGSPADFAFLVDYLHKHNVGVILDWVPAHFPRDAFGLAEFDGECLYEYADPRKGEHPQWGTKVFDYGKNEVKNFLIANALFWIRKYHIDGLRVDAVASMLYLDYERQDGQWVPNAYGGNENLEAVEFLKHLNSVVKGLDEGIMMIAEESTTWPKVTDRCEYGGLGFTFKWNMGWMHDFLDYLKSDPWFRKFNHNKMNFSMMYAYSEQFVLVLSHDEVVHLKKSMIEKMPGSYEEKFMSLKAGYAFMIGHPGKKLLFMGQDFGQHREWSEKRELDWFLLAKDENRNLQNYLRDLFHIYRRNCSLFTADNDPAGFEWINADDADRSIFSFVRHDQNGKNNLLFVCNFTPVARPDYRVGTTCKRKHTLIFNSDEKMYGGSGKLRPYEYKPVNRECDGRNHSFSYELPAYGVAIFRF